MKRFLMTMVTAAGLAVSAVQAQSIRDTHAEIEQAFGTVPAWFLAYPQAGQVAYWQQLKAVWLNETALDAKTKELVALTVAAQIP